MDEYDQVDDEIFDYDTALLQSTEPDLTGYEGVSLPYDTIMSATYTANQLDYQLPTVREILNTYRRQRETGALALTTDG